MYLPDASETGDERLQTSAAEKSVGGTEEEAADKSCR